MCECVDTERPIVVRERRRTYLLAAGKSWFNRAGYKGFPHGGEFWIYLEFQCGFVDGLNSPRANSRQMIERLPKRGDEIKEICVKFIRGEKSNIYLFFKEREKP